MSVSNLHQTRTIQISSDIPFLNRIVVTSVLMCKARLVLKISAVSMKVKIKIARSAATATALVITGTVILIRVACKDSDQALGTYN